MKFKKIIVGLVAGLALVAYAAETPTKIQTNQLQVGRQGSSADKKVILDVGQGVNNPAITSTNASQDIKLQSDLVRIGKPTVGTKVLDFDQNLGASNPKIQFNSSSSKFEFSNNGSDFKAIGSGSGSGSGINFLSDSNFDFESGATGWTASNGSTLTIATSGTNKLWGTRSAVFNSTTTGETVVSASISMTSSDFVGAAGGNGYASCFFKTSAVDYKIQAFDGTNVLAERTLWATTTAVEQGVTFPLPTTGSVSLRLISASDAADLAFDNCFLGTAPLFTQNVTITNPETYTPVVTHSSGGMTNATTTGKWTRVGKMLRAEIMTTFSGASAAFSDLIYSIPTGLTIDSSAMSSINGKRVGSGSIYDNGIQFFHTIVNYQSSNSVILFVGNAASTYVSSSLLTQAVPFTLGAGDTINFYFEVPIVEWSSNTAQRFETVGWKVDANISGANPALGTSAVTSYTGITNSSLTLTNNAGLGNISARIPCSATNAPTGTNCAAGDESIGVNFTLPAAGDVEACVSFSHQILVAGIGNGTGATFQIVETPSNAQTILQEGKSRIHSSVNTTSANTQAAVFPHRVCGVFSFGSAGEKTLRLMYEMATTGAPIVNVLLADADAATGQRDIHWEVKPLNQQIPAPILVGGVSGSGNGQMSIGSVRVSGAATDETACTSTPCTIRRPSGDWVTSIDRIGTGNYRLNIKSGMFSGVPSCVGSGPNVGTNQILESNTAASSATDFEYYIARRDTGAVVDSAHDIICVGAK